MHVAHVAPSVHGSFLNPSTPAHRRAVAVAALIPSSRSSKRRMSAGIGGFFRMPECTCMAYRFGPVHVKWRGNTEANSEDF